MLDAIGQPLAIGDQIIWASTYRSRIYMKPAVIVNIRPERQKPLVIEYKDWQGKLVEAYITAVNVVRINATGEDAWYAGYQEGFKQGLKAMNPTTSTHASNAGATIVLENVGN